MKSLLNLSPRLIVASAATGLALVAASPAIAQEADEEPPIEAETEAEAEAEAEAEEKAPEEMTKGEKRLAKLLEGRVAGEPTRCIRTVPSEPTQTIDGAAYVFGRGSTIYVQRTTRPERINDRESLFIRRFGGGSQLCRQEVVRTFDPVTRIFGGGVIFVDFVPYTRVDTDEEVEAG